MCGRRWWWKQVVTTFVLVNLLSSSSVKGYWARPCTTHKLCLSWCTSSTREISHLFKAADWNLRISATIRNWQSIIDPMYPGQLYCTGLTFIWVELEHSLVQVKIVEEVFVDIQTIFSCRQASSRLLQNVLLKFCFTQDSSCYLHNLAHGHSVVWTVLLKSACVGICWCSCVKIGCQSSLALLRNLANVGRCQ